LNGYDLKRMARESKARERERERAAKAATCYGVFPHAIDGKPTGRGLVVRPVDCSTGRAHDARNYGKLSPSRVFRRRADAERHV
jgi:hypothetical protein